MAAVPFLISLFIGYYMVCLLKSKDRALTLMDYCLMPGFGLGISAQIVFYSLLFLDCIVPEFIIQAHGVLLISFFIYFKRYPVCRQFAPVRKPVLYAIAAILLIVILGALLLGLSRPYGGWDGWSHWNYQALFFFESKHEWRRFFDFLMQSNHPFMLPLIIVWGWCFTGGFSVVIPICISVIFVTSCVAFLICALAENVRFSIALLGGLFLISIPFFLVHGTSQYADVLMAYFLLVSCVLVLKFLKDFTFENAVFLGLSLGFMSSTKENGIVAALLLLVMMAVRACRLKQAYVLKPLVLSFMSIGVSVILMKSYASFKAYSPTYGFNLASFFDVSKWGDVFQSILRNCIGSVWGGAWVVVAFMFLFLFKKLEKDSLIFIFRFLCYFMFLYIGIYLISALNVKWLLAVSFDRLLFLITPAVVFVMFSLLGKEVKRGAI